MAIESILQQAVAGPFLLEWGPAGTFASNGDQLVGVLGEGGIKEYRKYESEEISGDLLGSAALDAVHLGSQMFLEFNLEEANRLAVMRMSHPFTSTTITSLANTMTAEGEVGVPGEFYGDKWFSLKATPKFSTTTAGTQTTNIRTYHRCTMAAGFEMKKILSAHRRVVPMRIRVWPVYDSVSTFYRFYTKS